MTTTRIHSLLLPRLGLLTAVAMAISASTAFAITLGPGYTSTTLTTSDTPTGGLSVVGDTVFVGVGSFGGATAAIARLDGGGETIIADGFNSLAGFAYDAVNDRLIVGDNALEAAGSETGDTIYALANPFGQSGTPLRAANHTLFAAGTFAGVADIAFDPSDPSNNTLFLTNALFPAGEVLNVDLITPAISNVQSGLGFVAGIAADATHLYIGDLDPNAFTGRLFSAPLPGGGPLTTLQDPLDGQFDIVVASDGSLLVTSSAFGGSSSVLRIDPTTGAILEVVATGFDFATALAEENGAIYVIEGGGTASNQIFVISQVPEPSSALLVALGLARLGARRRSARSI